MQGRGKFLSSEQILWDLKVVVKNCSCYIEQMQKLTCSRAYREIFSALNVINFPYFVLMGDILTSFEGTFDIKIHIIFPMVGVYNVDSCFGMFPACKTLYCMPSLKGFWLILHLKMYIMNYMFKFQCRK